MIVQVYWHKGGRGIHLMLTVKRPSLTDSTGKKILWKENAGRHDRKEYLLRTGYKGHFIGDSRYLLFVVRDPRR